MIAATFHLVVPTILLVLPVFALWMFVWWLLTRWVSERFIDPWVERHFSKRLERRFIVIYREHYPDASEYEISEMVAESMADSKRRFNAIQEKYGKKPFWEEA